MSPITVIGRGHSGTRAMSQTLSASGVFMGSPLNQSGDLLPPENMYEACRIFARYVRWKRMDTFEASLEWDWSQLDSMEIDPEFTRLIYSYLKTVLESPAEHKGWKIPETTLVFPWIVRLFPEIKYIIWIRNPRDCILNDHLTDDLREWGIPYPEATMFSSESDTQINLFTDAHPEVADVPAVPSGTIQLIRLRRAISWKYQYDLVRATPKPASVIEVRFEDFVLNQEETLAQLEDFLGLNLARIPVKTETVGRWKLDNGDNYYDFFKPAMLEYGYEIPAVAEQASGDHYKEVLRC